MIKSKQINFNFSADLDVTVRRLLWGRFANAGQTCVGCDYVLTTDDIQVV
jgi:aldehyde dehydrogenase (NAD+)